MPAKGAGMEETAQPAQDEPASDANNSRLELQFEEGQDAGKAQSAMASATTPANGNATPAASAATPASQRSDGKSPGTPVRGCISSTVKGDGKVRTDSHGTIIVHGEKKHKATFLDEVKQGANIHEVKEVRSFKHQGVGCRCAVM